MGYSNQNVGTASGPSPAADSPVTLALHTRRSWSLPELMDLWRADGLGRVWLQSYNQCLQLYVDDGYETTGRWETTAQMMPATDADWVTIVVTWDPATTAVQCWVDGVAYTGAWVVAAPTDWGTGAVNVTFGDSGAYTDQPLWATGVKNSSWVLANYGGSGGLNRRYPDITDLSDVVSVWELDEGSGTVAADSHGIYDAAVQDTPGTWSSSEPTYVESVESVEYGAYAKAAGPWSSSKDLVLADSISGWSAGPWSSTLVLNLLAALTDPPTHVWIVGATGPPQTTNDSTPVVAWTNAGGVTQTAFQVRVTRVSDGVVMYSSGKITSVATQHEVTTALADDSYYACVSVWNDSDVQSAETSVQFLVSGGTDPGAWAAYSVADVYLPSVDCDPVHDGDNLTGVSLYKDGVSSTHYIVHSFPSKTIAGYRLRFEENSGYGTPDAGVTLEHWNGAAWVVDFTYTSTDAGVTWTLAIATTTTKVRVHWSGTVGSVSVREFTELVSEDDVTAPTIAFTNPLTGGTLTDLEQAISADYSDDTGVTQVQFLVDGAVVDTSVVSPAELSGSYAYTWDLEAYSNGAHTLTVRAYDAAGNVGSASITVTITTTLADSTRYWWSVKLPAALPNWELTGQLVRKAIATYKVDSLSSNPARNYLLEMRVNVPGTSVDWDDYQPITKNEAFAVVGDASTLRIAIKGTPQRRITFLDVVADEAYRLVPYTDPNDSVDKVAVLTRAPIKLLSYYAGALTTLFDGTALLANYVANDLTALEDKLYVALKPAPGAPAGATSCLLVFDLTTGENYWYLHLPVGGNITAVCARSSVLYIGLDTGELWILTGANLDLVDDATLTGGIERLYSGTTLYVMSNDGKVYTSTGNSAPTLALNTTEQGMLSAHEYVTVPFIGSSPNGRVYSNLGGGLSEEFQFSFSNVRALGSYAGKVFGGGNTANLWRRDSAASWAVELTLSGVTQINDMLEFDGMLMIATQGTNGLVSRLYRFETATGLGDTAQFLSNIGIELLEVEAA